ncbi:PrgI family protein [Streptomyces sp. NPDC102360]|uniref:PrgI family protein n=1 Tax=Streptomyces sp. NPDC102360 TaxID=3366160 RepID=UPI0038144D2C
MRIPADVDREDTVLANLTARQLLLLSVTGVLLYGLWALSRTVVPVAVFAVIALPVGGAAALLALGQRDGLSLDRLVLAAIRQGASPRHRVAAPEGILPVPESLGRLTQRTVHDGTRAAKTPSPVPLQLPAQGITETGVIDLGTDGIAAIGVCSTVNFALRTATEQESLVGGLSRYLHSLTAPVQILVRAERLDLSSQIAELRACAADLPHPALDAAAHEHADYLVELGSQADLLQRQVLIVLREPLTTIGPPGGRGGLPFTIFNRRASARHRPTTMAIQRAAEARLVRRLTEAVELLGPIGVSVTPLDAGQTTAVLSGACNSDSLIPPSSALASSDEVITGAAAPPTLWGDPTQTNPAEDVEAEPTPTQSHGPRGAIGARWST